MLSPTTLTFSVLALVVGDRPLRTGLWFYLGALTATLAVGIAAAFVIGDVAASDSSTPKTWVAIVDVVAAAAILAWVVRAWRSPGDPLKLDQMLDRMSSLATAPILAIVGAGAVLANPGGFIPLALKDISETDPTRLRLRGPVALLHGHLTAAARGRPAAARGRRETGRCACSPVPAAGWSAMRLRSSS